jgi:hypothetical protein
MKVDIYESTVIAGRFVTLPSGRDPECAGLPKERAYCRLCLVREAYVLPDAAEDAPIARMIESQIARRGFALHGFSLALYEQPRSLTPGSRARERH